MPDKREQILARLLEIAGGVEGIKTAMRNETLAQDTALPCIQILDADETADERDGQPGGRATPSGAARIGLNPEIYITLGDAPENVGTEINKLRARLVRAVLTDEPLRAITGSNGSIRYEACATGLSRGREMQAEMGVSFTFTYVLKPADLEGI